MIFCGDDDKGEQMNPPRLISGVGIVGLNDWPLRMARKINNIGKGKQ